MCPLCVRHRCVRVFAVACARCVVCVCAMCVHVCARCVLGVRCACPVSGVCVCVCVFSVCPMYDLCWCWRCSVRVLSLTCPVVCVCVFSMCVLCVCDLGGWLLCGPCLLCVFCSLQYAHDVCVLCQCSVCAQVCVRVLCVCPVMHNCDRCMCIVCVVWRVYRSCYVWLCGCVCVRSLGVPSLSLCVPRVRL